MIPLIALSMLTLAPPVSIDIGGNAKSRVRVFVVRQFPDDEIISPLEVLVRASGRLSARGGHGEPVTLETLSRFKEERLDILLSVELGRRAGYRSALDLLSCLHMFSRSPHPLDIYIPHGVLEVLVAEIRHDCRFWLGMESSRLLRAIDE